MRRLWWTLVGYNVAEVDEFVGRVRGTLGLEPLVGQPVTARDVEDQVFTESLGGYDKATQTGN